MSNTGVLAIVQARMNSHRLPGKVLLPISDGKGSLELMLERIVRANLIDQAVVATTTSNAEGPICDVCDSLGIKAARGSGDDVLDRFRQVVQEQGQDFQTIVRLTADCPLHDAEVIDSVIQAYLDGPYDYVSNVHPPTFPDGLDVEVFSCEALKVACRNAVTSVEREHVTPYMVNHPELFRIGNVECADGDFSSLRWTLDQVEDLLFVREVYEHFHSRGVYFFPMSAILSLLAECPEIAALNSGIMRNEGLLRGVNQ